MPRTRSLAWSELKIRRPDDYRHRHRGRDDLPVDRRPRIFLAALQPEDALRQCRRPEVGIARARGRRRSRHGDERRRFRRRADRRHVRSQQVDARADHDRLDRLPGVGVAARRERRRYHAVRPRARRFPSGATSPPGPPKGQIADVAEQAQQSVAEITKLVTDIRARQGHGRQADDGRAALHGTAAVRGDGRRVDAGHSRRPRDAGQAGDRSRRRRMPSKRRWPNLERITAQINAGAGLARQAAEGRCLRRLP